MILSDISPYYLILGRPVPRKTVIIISELILREGDRICAYFILVYILKLKVTTLSSRHLFEGFALRSTANNDQCVYFILRGNALGK